MAKSCKSSYSSKGLAYKVEENIVKVSYNGCLASNAENLYVRFGNQHWQETGDLPMKKTKKGYEAQLPFNPSNEAVKMCFNDGNNNWDNNDGQDYCIEIKK